MSLAYRLIRLVHFIHTRQQFIMDLEMIMYNYTHFMKAFFTRKQHTVSWYKHKCTFIYVHRKSTMFSAPNFTCVRAYTHRCTHTFVIWYPGCIENTPEASCVPEETNSTSGTRVPELSHLQSFMITSSQMMPCYRY